MNIKRTSPDLTRLLIQLHHAGQPWCWQLGFTGLELLPQGAQRHIFRPNLDVEADLVGGPGDVEADPANSEFPIDSP